MSRFAFFPGCLVPTRYPAMEFAIRTTLPKRRTTPSSHRPASSANHLKRENLHTACRGCQLPPWPPAGKTPRYAT